MMSVLVTGISSFLGFKLAYGGVDNHTVIGVVNKIRLRSNRFEVKSMDLLATGAVAFLLGETQRDWAVHCAAWISEATGKNKMYKGCL